MNKGIVGWKCFISEGRATLLMTLLAECKAFVDSAQTKNVNLKDKLLFCVFVGFSANLVKEKAENYVEVVREIEKWRDWIRCVFTVNFNMSKMFAPHYTNAYFFCKCTFCRR